MFQTVGSSVIPLYEQALGIPLYRQPILGSAVTTALSYQPPTDGEDETEALVPLLRRIMAAHPEANAVSTGAILSTYQRTRVESVATRLGLIPLSFLWQYPVLPPARQISLLEDMNAAQMDARLIKVATGGLDESFLWTNLASVAGMRRIEKAMARYGIDNNGAVLGEGGEYESLVIDGPRRLFKGRIVVDEADMAVVREGGGVACTKVKNARVQMKHGEEEVSELVRIPEVFEERFESSFLECLKVQQGSSTSVSGLEETGNGSYVRQDALKTSIIPARNWTFVAAKDCHQDVEGEARDIMGQLWTFLDCKSLDATDILHTVIVLRSMDDFAIINKVYGSLFTKPNPPSRVTIACGDMLPPGTNLVVHVQVADPELRPKRKALHVQSRSYWAPANIGPYSQAQSVPAGSVSTFYSAITVVHIAGQIPLVPHTMELLQKGHPSSGMDASDPLSVFKHQTILALQHLWRIGRATDVRWWTGAVVYLSKDSVTSIAQKAAYTTKVWKHLVESARPKFNDDGFDDMNFDDDDEPPPDLWEQRHHGGLNLRASTQASSGHSSSTSPLPDWSVLNHTNFSQHVSPPAFAVEVDSLPRGASVEWAALPALTQGPITLAYQMHYKGMGNIYVTYLGPYGDRPGMLDSRPIQLVVGISYGEIASVDDVASRIQKMWRSVCVNVGVAQRSYRLIDHFDVGSGYCGATAAWLDATLEGLWVVPEREGALRDLSGVVPCRSVWGPQGERLAAVLVFDGLHA
jgi:diphthine-ammonia ligase